MTAMDKSCGACRACCIALKIDTKEFQKPGQVLCPHHTGHGCGIYGKRPKICREFFCGWLLSPGLNAEWRPDRSGVLILQLAQKKLPEAYRDAGNGIQLLIVGGEDAVANPDLALYAAQLVKKKVAVYLHSATPHALVNDHLDEDLLADTDSVARILLSLYRLVRDAKESKSLLLLLPRLYRLRVEKRRAKAKFMVNESFKS